ncbi:MAG: hypothetical protein R3D67_07830 [Hyphomicrobiaceae bacterium]
MTTDLHDQIRAPIGGFRDPVQGWVAGRLQVVSGAIEINDAFTADT